MNLPIDSLEFSEDRVRRINIRWGLEYRPLWAVLEGMRPSIAIKWVDRFSAMESFSSEWALAQCFERALGLEVPERGNRLRIFHNEIQKLVWGFNYLCGVFNSIGDEIRKEQALYLRELSFGAQETLSGARVLPQLLTLGGIERDISVGEQRKMKSLIQQIESEMNYSFSKIEEDDLLKKALKGVLPIPYSLAMLVYWGGVVGASVNYDLDLTRGLALEKYYSGLNPKEVASYKIESGTDALNRFRACIFQIKQSLKFSIEVLQSLPAGPIQTKARLESELFRLEMEQVPNGIFLGYCDAGSGIQVATLADKKIRISSASTRLAPFLELVLQKVHRDDLNVAIASLGFDLSQGDLA